ncbi:MAG: hypothetical protein PHT60_09375 [Acidiphilium sp.]|nr:hypothetical protein [Acidiphilium sp.]MDD4935973.1 hypothetical protein [Acidiphilium sp.]
MIIVFGILVVAAALGGYLASGYLRDIPPSNVNRMIGVVHGAIGTLGFMGLVVALARPEPLATIGLRGFGRGAEVLLGLALGFGLLVVLASWQGKRPSGLVIGVHASVAITAIVLVSAIVVLG